MFKIIQIGTQIRVVEIIKIFELGQFRKRKIRWENWEVVIKIRFINREKLEYEWEMY